MDFLLLVKELDKELKYIYGTSQEEFDQYNIIENSDTVVIAYENDKPVSCGCFKKFDTNSAEIKRMFVAPLYRGRGIGAKILTELEKWALEMGNQFTVLETGIKQPEAVYLYKKLGYQVIKNYEPYIGNELSICMKKILTFIKE